jgi:antitoxin component YwqK of YwqJK toxin-antitoxin module
MKTSLELVDTAERCAAKRKQEERQTAKAPPQKDGETEGPWVSYCDNGQLWWKITWKDGKQEGPEVGYHSNGQLAWKITFKDGKKEGPSVAYYPTSQLYWKGTYKDGEREGPWVFFHQDGTTDMTGKHILPTWSLHQGTGTYLNGRKVND